MPASISVEPLTPALGAEISGVDIADIDDDQFDVVYHAWLRHKVILLRDQDIDLDMLERFSRRFGELMQLPYVKPYRDHPDIIRVLKQADEINMGVFGGEWHSDFSFLDQPPKASILHAEQIPAVGGDTLWINMALAWRQLPEELATQVTGKTAIHCGTPYGVLHAPTEDTRFKGSIEIERNNPQADRETRHPAVCRHPDTGEEMLFINPTYTIRIDGYAEQESHALLDKLFSHCTRPEYCCRLRWQPRTVVVWDNRNTMHYAVNDYDGSRRCLYRTTIKGDNPLPA
jgi:taurine dioxygenase